MQGSKGRRGGRWALGAWPEKEERVSRTVKIVISIAVLIAIAGIATYFLSKSAGTGPVIKTSTASKLSLKVTVAASGKISAGDRADVYPPTAGSLSAVYVKEGQAVKAGQKLAKLDSAPLRAAVKQAEAGLEQAQAGVEQAQAGVEAAEAGRETLNNAVPTHLDVDAADAAVTAARANYNNAKAAYYAAKVAPSNPTTVALASASMKTAKASLLSAQAAAKKVRMSRRVGEQRDSANEAIDSAQAGVCSANAAVDSAEAALEVAKANLENATMIAPMDGTVFLNPIGTAGANGKTPLPSPGAGVSPAMAPFSVVHLGSSTFTAEVDEADIDRVKLGMSADVTLDAFPGQTLKTTVVHINPAAQPTATGGTIFQVELALADTGKTILLGMKGDATIQVSAVEGALTIPVEALFNQNGQNYVYKLVNGKLAQTNITVGATTDTQIEVVSGLKDGDVVALAGSTQYSDGMAVRTQ
jgi:RND family efflux transporter MFP subunit